MRKTIVALGTLILPLLAGTAQAQVAVTRVATDTLRIIEFRGKPPHRRQVISEDRHPALYAHYSERIGYDEQPLYTVSSRGAPGKSLPRQSLRVSGDVDEVAEFARFEETDEATTDPRRWRGAPGKSTSRLIGR